MLAEHPHTTNALATPSEAAEYLSVSRSTIYELMNSGDLASVKIRRSRRINWADLRKLAADGVSFD